jgi:hypothetical protein
MFRAQPISKLTQRALGALRTASSFLLLEDDYDVDWEVGQDQLGHVSHPHRAPLRAGFARRRPGQPPAPAQACLSPVASAEHAHHGARARRADARASDGRGTGSDRTGSRVALDR